MENWLLVSYGTSNLFAKFADSYDSKLSSNPVTLVVLSFFYMQVLLDVEGSDSFYLIGSFLDLLHLVLLECSMQFECCNQYFHSQFLYGFKNYYRNLSLYFID
jgi:hypothetical protein